MLVITCSVESLNLEAIVIDKRKSIVTVLGKITEHISLNQHGVKMAMNILIKNSVYTYMSLVTELCNKA